MPISQQEQREREQRREDIEIEKATVEHDKYVKTLNDEAEALKKVSILTTDQQKRLDYLTERVKKSTEVLEVQKKVIKEKLEDMDKENTSLNRLTTSYDKYSKKVAGAAKEVSSSLITHHNYNLEVQKIIDLTGKFTRSTESGIDAFERMRKALNLTRQEGVEFGKVWSEVSRIGIDPSKFTQAAKQLQTVFGQKGGITAAGLVAQTKVSTPTLAAAMGGDQVAIIKAMRSATSVEHAYAIAGLTGGPRGALSGQAARFEKEQARVSRVKDDIQAGMAAALDLGLGPEIGALALPLAEINANVAKLLLSSIGMGGWLKTALTTGTVASKGGGAVATLTGAPKGGGLFPGFPGLGKVLGAGALAGGGLLAGSAALYAAKLAPETGPFGAKSLLTYGGRISQGAGVGAGIGLMLGGGVGAAVGGAAGGVAGAATAAYERNKEAADSWFGEILKGTQILMTEWLGTAEDLKRVDIQNSMIDLQTHAAGAATALENMANEVGNLPEMLEFKVAQARLPHALAGKDSGAMEDYLSKASKAADAAMAVNSGAIKEAMGKVKTDIGVAELAAKKERTEGRGGGKAELAQLEIVRSGRAELAKLELSMKEKMENINLMPAGEKAMERAAMQRGQRATELQKAEVQFEIESGGTGNVKAMRELQEKRRVAYTADKADLVKGYEQAHAAYEQTLKNAKIEQSRVGASKEEVATAKNIADNATDSMLEIERKTNLDIKQLDLVMQQKEIQMRTAEALAATETIGFKIMERREEILKGQQAMAMEVGAAPEVVGGFAERQATQATGQLDLFMKEYETKKKSLEADKAVAKTDVDRKAIEMSILDLAGEKLKLEMKGFQARMNAATAEEHAKQELIGANKRIAEIGRDTAAKLGMNWRVQMAYQQELINLSEQELSSKGQEITNVMKVIRDTQMEGGDVSKHNLKLKKLEGEYMQGQANLIEAKMGKQRSFLEQSTAASFGVGAGSRILPVINQRMFGQMVQGVGGLRMPGMGPTFQQQQRNMMGGGGIFGGIGMGVPGRGKHPGAPEAGAAEKAEEEKVAANEPQKVNVDVRTEVVLSDPILVERITTVMRNARKPGGILAQDA